MDSLKGSKLMNIVNIACYKFVTIPASVLPTLRAALKEKALGCELKGTVLLSTEGINLFLAGLREDIEAFKACLASYEYFTDLVYKESFSAEKPFTRMLVRLKKEIIPLGKPDIQPEKKTAPRLSPAEFKRWYETQEDMIVLDTRNDYEVALGTFEDAVDLHLDHFRNFADAVDLLPESAKEKPVVTFCTGGIRCEKAAEWMLQKGFKNVYQLDGGILKYFEECGGDFYNGECFVFDKRVALDSQLQETQTTQCYACRTPLTVAEQRADGSCPHCQTIQQKAV